MDKIAAELLSFASAPTWAGVVILTVAGVIGVALFLFKNRTKDPEVVTAAMGVAENLQEQVKMLYERLDMCHADLASCRKESVTVEVLKEENRRLKAALDEHAARTVAFISGASGSSS